MASRTARFIAWVQRQAGHPWKWTACLLVPIADYIVPLLPANTLLMSLCAGHPKRWLRFALSFALSNAVGALAISWLLGLFGHEILSILFGEVTEGSSWESAHAWLKNYGLWILIPLSMMPFPPRIAVAAAGIAGLNPALIGLSVFGGRLVPMLGFGLLGVRTPNWAKRFTLTRRLLDNVASIQQERLAESTLDMSEATDSDAKPTDHT